MASKRMCLANGSARHHWKDRTDAEGRRVRECQGCGMLERRGENGRYVQVGSTR